MFRTLHPMIVHFPITLFYVTALFEVLYLAFRRDWLMQASFVLLTLAILSGAAAGLAGWLSERYVLAHISQSSLGILNRHKNFAELSVFTYGLAWLVRGWYLWRRERLSGMPYVVYGLLIIVGLGLITYTGFLGGSLVYDHGVGVP